MQPMQRAIGLARQALGTTSPNPAVGAVIVGDGKVLGEGFTLPPGQHHAEIGALDQAGAGARGATLYTTLEPCCNFGRTPPCTRAIIAAGIGRVHVAAIDPNPRVAGRGCAELEAAGIEVVVENGIEATELYRAFAKHINTGLPYVTAKFASSLDGKIATHTGDSKWVTGPAAREVVQQMRRVNDAIMVGINTVLADDPQLTARDSSGNALARQPLRVVLDAHCRTPVGAKMLGEPGTTLIAATAETLPDRVAGLESAGAEVIKLPASDRGMVEPLALLADLGSRGVVSLMVEGGGTVLGSLFDAGLVDEVYAFIAPVIIGGQGASSPVEGQGAIVMADAWRLEGTQIQQIGPDWLIKGHPAKRE
jgi:diaminohydroxyphosphoribosylaminopyrimidine deaminase/5-amino-6-(5-phosphoribosylamino)uracil reductase